MSVNDAGDPLHKVKEGLESLIRQIYYITNNTKSTIILIEQFPFPNYHRKSPIYSIGENDYSEVYQVLAKRYHTFLWSIRDVYWTYNDSINNNEVIQHYPLNPLHPFQYDNHPPWFVHLFMADLMASGYLHVLHNIKLYNSKTIIDALVPIIEQQQQLQSIYYNTSLKTLVLPKPIYDISDLWKIMCDINQPYLIDIHPGTHFKPENLTAYELMSDVGWREYIDYHDKSGIMINKYSNESKRTLTYTYNREDIKLNLRNYILKIEYLKSYENIGKLKIYMCNKYVNTIDGLDIYHSKGFYTDGRSQKASVPEVYTFDDIYVACNNNNDFNLQLIYYVDDTEINRRKSSKFKILSVEICIRSPEF